MSEVNEQAVTAMRAFLEALGVDLKARGMEKTPERVAKMYADLFRGMGKSTRDIWGDTFASDSCGIVAVRHIPFYSMCEHHLVPFFGEVNIAYLPDHGHVAGFGKFVDVVDTLARQPQLQERLTAQIARSVLEDLRAKGVLVTIEAEQLCMTMRKGMAQGTRTLTSESGGVFQENVALCREAWSLLGGLK